MIQEGEMFYERIDYETQESWISLIEERIVLVEMIQMIAFGKHQYSGWASKNQNNIYFLRTDTGYWLSQSVSRIRYRSRWVSTNRE